VRSIRIQLGKTESHVLTIDAPCAGNSYIRLSAKSDAVIKSNVIVGPITAFADGSISLYRAQNSPTQPAEILLGFNSADLLKNISLTFDPYLGGPRTDALYVQRRWGAVPLGLSLRGA
jgi:hypothetical protein